MNTVVSIKSCKLAVDESNVFVSRRTHNAPAPARSAAVEEVVVLLGAVLVRKIYRSVRAYIVCSHTRTVKSLVGNVRTGRTGIVKDVIAKTGREESTVRTAVITDVFIVVVKSLFIKTVDYVSECNV